MKQAQVRQGQQEARGFRQRLLTAAIGPQGLGCGTGREEAGAPAKKGGLIPGSGGHGHVVTEIASAFRNQQTNDLAWLTPY